jgi:hypothetical protein
MELSLMLGTLFLTVVLILIYLMMGGKKEKYPQHDKQDCLFCDDGTCVHCRERATSAIKYRYLLYHAKECHFRETLGKGPCDCGSTHIDDLVKEIEDDRT